MRSLSVHGKTTNDTCSKCGKTFARVDNLRRHQKNCCRCKQCAKQFKSMSSLKEHNCAKKEEAPNLSLDKETNFNNLDNLEAVSRNEQTSSNRDGFEADSNRNEPATLSRDTFEVDSTRNEQATSSEFNKQPKRKSLKIKRRAYHDEDEATVPIECPAAKKSKREIMQEEKIEESDPDLKQFIKNIGQAFEALSRITKCRGYLILTTTKI